MFVFSWSIGVMFVCGWGTVMLICELGTLMPMCVVVVL